MKKTHFLKESHIMKWSKLVTTVDCGQVKTLVNRMSVQMSFPETFSVQKLFGCANRLLRELSG